MRSDVCQTLEEWNDELSKLEALSDEIFRYKGRLSESADMFNTVMTLRDEAYSWIQQLYVFANDKQDMITKLDDVITTRNNKMAYINEEIEKMDKKTVKKFMSQNKNLKRLKKYFDRIFHDKKIKEKMVAKKK
jgi:oligoendopeptidase F